MNDAQKKLVLAALLGALIGWSLKPMFVAPQPRRPILAWIANTAKAVGLAFLFTRVFDEPPDPAEEVNARVLSLAEPQLAEVPLMRAVNEHGVPVIDNGEGW